MFYLFKHEVMSREKMMLIATFDNLVNKEDP